MKKLLIAVVCIVLVVIGVLVVGVLNIGPILETAVNTYGPDVVKTRVGVKDVDVSVFSAQAQLKDFVLGNPEGFATPDAVRVRSIYLDLDESSLTKDTIVIDRIDLVSPEFTYEIKGNTDNFRMIMDQARGAATDQKASRKKASAGTAAEKKGKTLLIRDFRITGGKVNLSASMLGGRTVNISLPDIHLQNIGLGEEGASPKEVFMKVFEEVYGKITSPDSTREFSARLKELGIAFEGLNAQEIRDARDKLEEVKTKIKGVGEQLKGLFHNQ